MDRQSVRTVAILGGGPAGASLATFLSRAGRDVVLFATGKRPPIIVGESLVPAVVPYLQSLGIEEEVAAYSEWKGGATFVLNTEQRLDLAFEEIPGARTTYSYNVPRDRFDATMLETARRAGVQIVNARGRVERVGETDRLRLDAATLEAATGVLHAQPDFIVDAGGRTRQIARLFDLPTTEGGRRDAALHAHLEGVEVEVKGNVHTDRLEHGWCWRIPLPGRVSLGFVMSPEALSKFGDGLEEQYDTALRCEPVLREWARDAQRVTPVVRYSNYQLRTARGVGENWALVGDAFGFIDPVFSSGMFIALETADRLAKAILEGTPRAMERYERRSVRDYAAWQHVVDLFYSGRLFTLFQVGEYVRHTTLGRLMDHHFRGHMARIFTGESIRNRYSVGLITFMAQHGLAGNDPERLRIH